jgi:acetyl-CoA acyltransferase 1
LLFYLTLLFFFFLVCGVVLGPSNQRANEVRMAAFMAGYPSTVSVHTLNRQCSSGLQAIAEVAAAIKAGYYEVGVAAGMESMSTAKFGGWEGPFNPKLFLNQQAKDWLICFSFLLLSLSFAHPVLSFIS